MPGLPGPGPILGKCTCGHVDFSPQFRNLAIAQRYIVSARLSRSEEGVQGRSPDREALRLISSDVLPTLLREPVAIVRFLKARRRLDRDDSARVDLRMRAVVV